MCSIASSYFSCKCNKKGSITYNFIKKNGIFAKDRCCPGWIELAFSPPPPNITHYYISPT